MEIDKPGYQTPGRLTNQGIRPQGDWQARVSDPREIDKPGYQTPGRLTHQSQIYELKIQKIGEFLTKMKNILTSLSGAQVGPNYEISTGQKSRWTVPLKNSITRRLLCSHPRGSIQQNNRNRLQLLTTHQLCSLAHFTRVGQILQTSFV